MSWFYALQGQQRGPLDQAAFDQLAGQGVITPDTLVWREGMLDWQPYADVVATSPSAFTTVATAGTGSSGILCAECKRPFAPTEVIRLNNSYVCATCKPILLQKLREGVEDSEAIRIRKAHISHEASVKSIGLLYFLGAAFLLLNAARLLSAGVSPNIFAYQGIFYILAAAVHIVAGVGVRQLLPWGRITSAALAGFGLVVGVVTAFVGGAFMAATAIINAYILYLLFSRKGKMVFSADYKRIIAQTPDIKYRTSFIIWALLGLLLLALLFAAIGMFVTPFRR